MTMALSQTLAEGAIAFAAKMMDDGADTVREDQLGRTNADLLQDQDGVTQRLWRFASQITLSTNAGI